MRRRRLNGSAARLVEGAVVIQASRPNGDGLHRRMIKRFVTRVALFRTGSTKGVDAQFAPKLRRILLRLILREDCLRPLGLTVTAAAKGLGVSRGSLSELLNGRNGVSPEMAIRLEMAGWGSAESWLRNQLSHDLWRARQRAGSIKVKRFPAPEVA